MKFIIFSFVAFVFLLSSTSFVIGHGETDEFYDDHHSGMMSGFYGTGIWGMGLFGWLFMILILIALILLIVWLVRQLQDSRRTNRRKR